MIEEEIMDLQERRKRLSEIARKEGFNRQFKVSDVSTAIDLLCKIDGIYKQQIEIKKEVRHTFIFHLPDGREFLASGKPSNLLRAKVEASELRLKPKEIAEKADKG